MRNEKKVKNRPGKNMERMSKWGMWEKMGKPEEIKMVRKHTRESEK